MGGTEVAPAGGGGEGPDFAALAEMNVGAELADARRKLGLSLDDVSAGTKISVERLSAIEAMEPARLPSLVYLKGFVRAFAAEVQLDPDTTTQRYLGQMDVVSLAALDGDRSVLDEFETESAQDVPARPPTPRAQPPAASTQSFDLRPLPEPAERGQWLDLAPPPVAHETPQPYSDAAEFFEPPPSPSIAPPPVSGPPDEPTLRTPVEQQRSFDAPLYTSDAPPSDDSFDRVSETPGFDAADFLRLPPAAERRSPLRAVAVLLLVLGGAVLVGWVIGQNYDAIVERVDALNAPGETGEPSSADSDDAASTSAAPRQDSARAESAGTPDVSSNAGTPSRAGGNSVARTQNPPARDADTSAPPSIPRAAAPPDAARDRAATAHVQPGADRAAESRGDRSASPDVAERTAAAAGAKVDPPSRTSADRDAAAREKRAEAQLVEERASAPPSEGDLTGRWTLTNRVETSSYKAFNGMNVGFQLQLRQEGNRITGTGRKWMENGHALPPSARTPIAVEGSISDGKLQLNFTERGTQRESAGTFVLSLLDASTLSGTFSSDAANSQGTSLARRQQN